MLPDSHFTWKYCFHNDSDYATSLIIMPPMEHKFQSPYQYDGAFAYLQNLVYVPFSNHTLTGAWHTSWGNAFRNCPNLMEVHMNYWSASDGSSWGRMLSEGTKATRIYITKMDNNPDLGTGGSVIGIANLEVLIWNGAVGSIYIPNAPMTREALIDLFNSIGTPSTTQTITIGATNLAKLTAEDIAIATAKNWQLS